MEKNEKQLKPYETPSIVEYGDIHVLTAANLCPGKMDFMYYAAIINNEGGGIEELNGLCS